MNTRGISRAIQARLGYLMGSFATGTVTARSTAASGTVPAGAFGVPIVNGELLEAGSVFVTRNPATADGSWPVTVDGTAVAVEAMQGGPIGNAQPGTEYVWKPQLSGIEERAITDDGVEGAEASEGEGAIRQLQAYKQITQANFEELWRAQVGEFPAVVLSRERIAPLDGPLAASPGPRSSATGQRSKRYRAFWSLFLITTRYDGEAARREEGDILLDGVCDELYGATGARDGLLRISSDPGIEILDAGIFKVTPTSYVDLVRFQTVFTLKQKTRAEAKPWLKSHIERRTEDSGASPPLKVPDVVVDMKADPDEDDEDS